MSLNEGHHPPPIPHDVDDMKISCVTGNPPRKTKSDKTKKLGEVLGVEFGINDPQLLANRAAKKNIGESLKEEVTLDASLFQPKDGGGLVSGHITIKRMTKDLYEITYTPRP